MNDARSTDPADSASNAGFAVESLSSGAAERRRMLLKGIGRGGAVVAAAMPLRSFATLHQQRLITLDRTRCSVSGMHSGVLSVAPGSVECSGRATSTFGSSTQNWPSIGIYTPNTPCRTIFKRCSLRVGVNNATLWQVVHSYPTSDDAHWVCAWLNAQGPASLNFPYTAAEVLAYYDQNNANALTFFKSYTERS